ncbi:hypothetical protein N7468_009441 [Penicillium chermesinum]|uniref:Haloacid dehalogenase-like hydrolase n=1 Tax=Penicillium chermesinum TaxID=63820 RepID=A0A9W9NI14_9EURO|nr:uncharacterized protein N7468_009441 [Penicillium chermesinum]KAJ5220237.1 hypothetical protein N7468_009441 [Penicillium chermesinum]
MLPRHAYTGLRQVSTKPSPRRTLLLTFDAFDTLFTPRTSVPEQYASVAHEFGLPRTAITPQAIQSAFKAAYKAQAKKHYNYGRAEVLRGQYAGPKQWWTDVIRATIEGALSQSLRPGSSDTSPHSELPAGLVETLLHRFAGAEGYALFEDVEPFFARLREVKRAVPQLTPYERVFVGVVSNSDDRVPAVLRSLGLKHGVAWVRRAGESEVRSSPEIAGLGSVYEFMSQAGRPGVDIDMVITSYEAGEEKPGRVIFDVARRQAGLLLPSGVSAESLWCVHVGDDYEKDYLAARGAGWQSCFLDRKGGVERPGLKIRSLMELVSKLRLGHEMEASGKSREWSDLLPAGAAGHISGR